MIKPNNIIPLIYLIAVFFCSASLAQTTSSERESWDSFKEAAHEIGFCIYHFQQNACNEHFDVKQQLEKISDPNSDVYYFRLEASWANERLSGWAETNESSPDNYFILFDIDQRSIRQLYDSTKTSNSYMMFSIIDLRDQFRIENYSRSGSGTTFKISANRPEAFMSNAMWREFMSNRLGRLENTISISLTGPNALEDYSEFKEAFLKFVNK